MEETLTSYDFIPFEVNTTNKTELYENISNELSELGYVKNTFKDSIIQREKSYPTGIQLENLAIALPHTDCVHVNKSVIAVTFCKLPIVFQNMENPNEQVSAKLVFLLALKSSEEHLAILSGLTQLLQDKKLSSELLHAGTSKQATKILKINLSI